MDWTVTMDCSVVIQAIRHVLLGVSRAIKIGCSHGEGLGKHKRVNVGESMLCYDYGKWPEQHKSDERRRAE